MEDAPVFYSASMLKLLTEIQAEPVFLALLENEAKEPVVALPIFKGQLVQNAHYSGWDNLKLMQSKSANHGDEVEFWNQILTKHSLIKLTCVSEVLIRSIANANVDYIYDERRKCPYISLGNSWSELHEKLGKKLTRNIRQYGNKATANRISFQINKAADISTDLLNEKLKRAFSFHETRMEAINQKSVFTPQQEQAYHLQVLKNVRNTFVIEAKNEDQRTIAFYYGLFNNSRLAWFNGGYDTQYYKYSIGTLLVAELISWAYENGLHIFDFLRGNESYKQRWTSDFDRNYSVYLSDYKLKNWLRIRKIYFNDSRQRVGGRRAIQMLIKSIS